MGISEYVSKKLRHSVEHRFQGTLWMIGKPPLYYGLCDVYQPKEGSNVIAALVDTGHYKAEALKGDIQAGCKFVISKGKGDVYVSKEIWPYDLKPIKLLCPFPWDEPLLILTFEAERRRQRR